MLHVCMLLHANEHIVVIVVVHELYHQLCRYDAILPTRFCQGVQDSVGFLFLTKTHTAKIVHQPAHEVSPGCHGNQKIEITFIEINIQTV